MAVVCDGVSTSTRPDEASLAAAQAAAQVLTTAAESGADLVEASTRAVQSAGKAVAQLAEPGASVPSATFVSAVLTGQAATLCWLGDSRAYWLAAAQDSAAEQLTTDDSLAQEMVNAGLLHQSEALTSPHAHVVTRWVGADPAEAPPHVATFEPPGPGVLLLCSDGLWNYQPEAAELAAPGAAPGADRPARRGQGTGPVRDRVRRPGQHHRGAGPVPARGHRRTSRRRSRGSSRHRSPAAD